MENTIQQAIVAKNVLEGIHQVLRLTSLEPTAVTNRVLKQFVTLCVHDKQLSPPSGIEAYIDPVSCVCMSAECALEYYWVKKILTSQNPSLMLEYFPYIQNYREQVQCEIPVIQSYTSAHRLIFIGCGPLPVSAMLYAQAGYSVTCVDKSTESVNYAKQLLDLLGFDSVTVLCSDVIDVDLSDFDIVLCAAMIPPEVLRHLHHVMLFARTVSGYCRLLYTEVPGDLIANFYSLPAPIVNDFCKIHC